MEEKVRGPSAAMTTLTPAPVLEAETEEIVVTRVWAAWSADDVGLVWDAQPTIVLIRPNAAKARTAKFTRNVLMLKLSSRFLKFNLSILYSEFSHHIFNLFFDHDTILVDFDDTA